MKRNILWVAAIGLAWGAVCAFGQERVIQPSPAYYPAGYAPAAPHPAPAVQPAPPAVHYPSPAAHPIHSPPPPPRQLTLAPAPAPYEEEAEDGLYWFWGQKWPGLALGPKIGTPGVGLELIFGVHRRLNLRSGFNYGSFTWNLEVGEVEYDMDVELTSIPLLVDIHPFAGHFRITGGFYIQPGTEADIQAAPDKNVQIGQHKYPPEVIGALSGKIEVADVFTPYLGFGFGNAVAEDQLLTFMVDIGVLFQSYDASLTADGEGMTTKLDTFRKDLALEEANLQKDVDGWKIYPVLAFGIALHF